jgi:hypothetical protein
LLFFRASSSKAFKEAIGIAVVLVIVYLLLNLIVVCVGLYHVAEHPSVISNWQKALLDHPRVGGNWTMIIFIGLLVFPKLALGLSGFETSVAVMPLVKGDANDTEENPHGRNTQHEKAARCRGAHYECDARRQQLYHDAAYPG